MKIYLTNCCKDKRKDSEPLEVLKRYISDRIEYVYEKSRKDNTEFRVLSGKFGLLKFKDKIPYYDHQLQLKDLTQLKKVLLEQLKSQKIDSVVFFSRDPNKFLDLKLYIGVIQQTCAELNIFFERRDVDNR